jgi:hypothetical protein
MVHAEATPDGRLGVSRALRLYLFTSYPLPNAHLFFRSTSVLHGVRLFLVTSEPLLSCIEWLMIFSFNRHLSFRVVRSH